MQSHLTLRILPFPPQVALTFALRYLNSFTKATALSTNVSLKLSKEVSFDESWSFNYGFHAF